MQIREYIYPSTGTPREFDIITKKHIIEIKSGTYKGKTQQFKAQQKFAKKINKTAVVLAPDYSYKQIQAYTNNGIKITNNINTLLQILKENEK